jgi:hypothetical protein
VRWALQPAPRRRRLAPPPCTPLPRAPRQVLFRVALALLTAAEPRLLAFDNAGEMILAMRAAAGGAHDRDGLMRVAFEGVGSLPMAVIDRYRGQGGREVAAGLRERGIAGGGAGGGGGARSPGSGGREHEQQAPGV